MNAVATDDTLSLWAFFRRWQQLDQAAGHQSVDLGSYFALLEAVSNGLTLGNRDALRALCRAVLVKPHHRLDVFDREFDQIWLPTPGTESPTAATPDRPSAQQSPSNEPSSPPVDSVTPPPTPNESPAETHPTPEPTPETPRKTASKSDPRRVGIRVDSLGEGDETELGWEHRAKEGEFQLEGNYEPVEERSLWQHIRQLRTQTYRDTRREADLAATIERVSQRGTYEGVVRTRTPRYEVPVALLLDRRGSMVPFHHLSDRLGQIVNEQAGGSVRYFQNHCERLLFKKSFLTDPESMEIWKRRLRPQSLVLIVSDAGSARGFFMENRVTKTKQMLQRINDCPNVFRVVWLNPMPRERWWATSAEDIAELVPMFAFDETEISTAIKTLTGHMPQMPL